MITIPMMLFFVLIACGASLFFVGFLFTFLAALGNKRYLWGGGMFVFFPLVWVYAGVHFKETDYSAKLLFGGTLMTVMAALLLITVTPVEFKDLLMMTGEKSS